MKGGAVTRKLQRKAMCPLGERLGATPFDEKIHRAPLAWHCESCHDVATAIRPHHKGNAICQLPPDPP